MEEKWIPIQLVFGKHSQPPADEAFRQSLPSRAEVDSFGARHNPVN